MYAYTTFVKTGDLDFCKRRTKLNGSGLISIKHSKVVAEYNTHMGGVDLADQQRLHCQTNVIGFHRWWIRMFFYLIDVACLLYMEHTGNHNMNMPLFKQAIVKQLWGVAIYTTIKAVDDTPKHVLVAIGWDNKDICSCCKYCVLICGSTTSNSI